MKLLLLLAPFLLAAATKPAPLTGSWAGDHVALEIADGGARLEYDCASGTIDGVLTPDRKGRFKAAGTHREEHGGPVRIGEGGGVPARYSGSVRGSRMTLTVTLDGGEKVGTFTLVKGREPSLVKCR